MVAMIRSVVPVLAGLVVAFSGVAGGEFLGQKLFPVPPDVDLSTPAAIKTDMEQGMSPTGALASVLLSWGFATVVGSYLAALFAPRAKLTHGMVVGAIFLAATIANLMLLPHPLWMWVLGVAEILPAAYLGSWLAQPRMVAAKPEPTPEVGR